MTTTLVLATLTILVQHCKAQNSTESGSGSGDDLAVPLAVTTVALLAFAIIVGLLIGRFAEHLHDRYAIRDDASDISLYTRELLKAQLLLAFSKNNKQKKGEKLDPREAARKYSKVWRAKTARNKARRLKEARKKDVEKGKVGTQRKASIAKLGPKSKPTTIKEENESSRTKPNQKNVKPAPATAASGGVKPKAPEPSPNSKGADNKPSATQPKTPASAKPPVKPQPTIATGAKPVVAAQPKTAPASSSAPPKTSPSATNTTTTTSPTQPKTTSVPAKVSPGQATKPKATTTSVPAKVSPDPAIKPKAAPNRKSSDSSRSEYEFLAKDDPAVDNGFTTQRGTPHSISGVKIEPKEGPTGSKPQPKTEEQKPSQTNPAKPKTSVMGNVQSTDTRPKSGVRPTSSPLRRPMTGSSASRTVTPASKTVTPSSGTITPASRASSISTGRFTRY